MQKTYYFITIDKTQSTVAPTKDEYKLLLDALSEKYQLSLEVRCPVQCFEFKKKGNKLKGTLVHNWLHYHGILTSEKVRRRKLKIIKKGYSIKIIELETMRDVLFYSGYIQKHMTDQTDYNFVPPSKCENVFDEYAFTDSDSVTTEVQPCCGDIHRPTDNNSVSID